MKNRKHKKKTQEEGVELCFKDSLSRKYLMEMLATQAIVLFVNQSITNFLAYITFDVP